jgi:protein-tyrosine phosphatase
MAEFIFKKMVSDAGREDEFYIASCATSTEEICNGIGNPVYPPARRELLSHGIDPQGKRAVQLTFADHDRYDLFVCMDSANVRNATRILNGDCQNKVVKLLSFAGRDGDVSDPWYTDRFDVAFKDILEGCNALFNKLTQTK